MDVTSLYTNIPQNEGIEVVYKAYENFYKDNPPIPSHYLREMLRLILKENSFQFNGKHYLQTHGTAMGTKTAVSFANIFMAHIETTILSRTVFKPTVWKRYIDDIFSLWDISKPDIEAFIEQANLHHPTIKFTAEISDTETMFLDTVVYKGARFKEKSRGKRNIAFRDTVPALSVYFKRSFNEKMESYTKPTLTSPNFQRTTYHFLQERKISKGNAR